MKAFKQYDVFELAKDINTKITKGMKGVILEVYDSKSFEVEFVTQASFIMQAVSTHF